MSLFSSTITLHCYQFLLAFFLYIFLHNQYTTRELLFLQPSKHTTSSSSSCRKKPTSSFNLPTSSSAGCFLRCQFHSLPPVEVPFALCCCFGDLLPTWILAATTTTTLSLSPHVPRPGQSKFCLRVGRQTSCVSEACLDLLLRNLRFFQMVLRKRSRWLSQSRPTRCCTSQPT